MKLLVCRWSLIIIIITLIYEVITAPNKQIAKKMIRQQKAPSYPYHYQVLVPNLQVIPVHGNRWNDNAHNNRTLLYPIHNLVPVHELVPVNQLSVVPLRRQDPVYHYQDEDRYRTPIGGYGVGWRYGGHGAGHGFYYGFG